MIDFTVMSSVVDNSILELQGVSDLEFVSIGSDNFLFVAAEADSAITSFKLSATLAPQLVDTVLFSATSGTFTVGHLTITDVNGALTLLPSARHDDNTSTYLIDNTGNLSAPVTQPGGAGPVGHFIVTQSVVVAGKTYLYAAERGISGIAGYWMQPGDSFSNKVTYANATYNYFGDVAAFASTTIGTQSYLFTASAFDAGLNSFRVGQDGALQLIDSVAPADTSGFSLPQALETVSVNGQEFLLMASAGSDSITVYALDAAGALSETDHLIDTVGMRFNDASVLESFTHDDRSFILAAGSDDGLTLLELTAAGKLSFLAVLADDFNTTLNNITAIEVVKFGTEIHAFVGSGPENGFTQIKIDIAEAGLTIVGTAAHETLNGSGLDDTISGMAGSDRLFGAAGADILIDGSGRDHFYGGAGADTFRFVADGTLDLIRDYQPGVDLIDLSLIVGVSGIGNVTVNTRSFGAIVVAGNEVIRVQTLDGTLLDSGDFTANDFIF